MIQSAEKRNHSNGTTVRVTYCKSDSISYSPCTDGLESCCNDTASEDSYCSYNPCQEGTEPDGYSPPPGSCQFPVFFFFYLNVCWLLTVSTLGGGFSFSVLPPAQVPSAACASRWAWLFRCPMLSTAGGSEWLAPVPSPAGDFVWPVPLTTSSLV